MKTMTSKKMIAAGLLAGVSAASVSAASVQNVLFDLANQSDQLGLVGDYTFDIIPEESFVVIEEDGPAGIEGDIITTFFEVDSVSTTGPGGTFQAFFDRPANTFSGSTFETTVGVYGVAKYKVVDVTGPFITVTAEPDTEALFKIYEDNDPGTELVASSLAIPGAGVLFGEVGTPGAGNTLTFTSLGPSSAADLTLLDFMQAVSGPIAFLGPDLVPQSVVTVSVNTSGATQTGASITIPALVVPSPTAAFAGMAGLAVLGLRRRRSIK